MKVMSIPRLLRARQLKKDQKFCVVQGKSGDYLITDELTGLNNVRRSVMISVIICLLATAANVPGVLDGNPFAIVSVIICAANTGGVFMLYLKRDRYR